jgi:hypothetical protein
MIVWNNKKIIDPALIEDRDVSRLRLFLLKDVQVKIPEYLISNKDKKIYKTGFLYEMYLLVYPEALKKDLIKLISDKYQLFVDERQCQNLIHEYFNRKYSNFVKK